MKRLLAARVGMRPNQLTVIEFLVIVLNDLMYTVRIAARMVSYFAALGPLMAASQSSTRSEAISASMNALSSASGMGSNRSSTNHDFEQLLRCCKALAAQCAQRSEARAPGCHLNFKRAVLCSTAT